MGGNLHSFWLLMLSCCSSFGSLWSLVYCWPFRLLLKHLSILLKFRQCPWEQ
jgi:hypothetical protein